MLSLIDQWEPSGLPRGPCSQCSVLLPVEGSWAWLVDLRISVEAALSWLAIADGPSCQQWLAYKSLGLNLPATR